MLSDTIWDLVLAWLISGFIGMVVGQFIEPREMILTVIMWSMAIGTVFLIIYYAFLAWREWKHEQKKHRRGSIYRGRYVR